MTEEISRTGELPRRPPDPPDKVTELTARALQHEYALSMGIGLRLTAVGAAASALLIQLVVVKRPVHWVVTGLLVALSVCAGTLAVITRGSRTVPHRLRFFIGILVSTVALATVAYLGVLSATVLVLGAVVYSSGTSDWRAEAWSVYLVCAVGYLGLALLSLTGVLPLTESILALSKENVRALVGLTLLVQMILGFTFWFAGNTRRATRAALSQVAEARLEVVRRGALLAEAREDLRRAVDAARLGRHSGETIGGFLMGEVIGRGAMGEVYAASGPQGAVAVKVLHPHLADSAGDVARFERELEIARMLRSPHVARLIANGVTPEGAPFLVMELLSGSDLGSILRDRGTLTVRETSELVRDVANALDEASAAGIVHRDIKPQNLFRVLEPAQAWKVLDFGVSRFIDTTSSLTEGAIGTPSYMAPEQCRGEPVDHRADVFALAVVAYRALTGQPPFSGPDHFAVLYAVVNEQPARPSDLVPLPLDVDAVIAIGLAKERSERFQSATELADALSRAAHNALPGEIRERAARLLARAPWSSALSGERRDPVR